MIGVVASAVVSIIVTVTVVIKTGMDILSVIVTVTVVIVSAVAANIMKVSFFFNLTIYQLLISNFTHIVYTELDIIGCGGEAINSGVKVRI